MIMLTMLLTCQVGVTVIAWEYERQRKKDLDKKAKEDAFRQQVDQKYLDEKKVPCCLQHDIEMRCLICSANCMSPM